MTVWLIKLNYFESNLGASFDFRMLVEVRPFHAITSPLLEAGATTPFIRGRRRHLTTLYFQPQSAQRWLITTTMNLWLKTFFNLKWTLALEWIAACCIGDVILKMWNQCELHEIVTTTLHLQITTRKNTTRATPSMIWKFNQNSDGIGDVQYWLVLKIELNW